GVIGLRVAGVLADAEHVGSFGPVMAGLALGPAVVAVIVIAFYPETAHTELEVLNPGDAALPTDPEALARLDESWAAEHEHHAHHLDEAAQDPPDMAAGGPAGSIPPRV